MGIRAISRPGALAVAVVLALVGCKGKTGSSSGGGGYSGPFQDAAPAAVYVPKVKMLLTGLAATDAEVQAVSADPSALRGLIDGWMALPQFQGRMLDFFRNAFQQNNVDLGVITSSLDVPDFYPRWEDRARLERAVMDSFPLTAWELVQEGRPFHETVTTRRYMMTTAMMAMLGYADMFQVDDAGDAVERLTEATSQHLVYDVLATEGDGTTPLTVADSVGQFTMGGSGSWTWRIAVPGMTTACLQELQQQRAASNAAYLPWSPQWNRTGSLLSVLFGGEDFADLPDGSACAIDWSTDANRPAPLLQDSDWSDWRMVTVEAIAITDAAALPTPYFWDLPGLRAATTLKLKSPRLGFFGTLAWDANWPTNESNQARVTANQALIVALGESIIPAGAIAPAPVNAGDVSHATDPACAACHKVLDPLRQFFRQSYTFSYHEQRDLGQYLGSAAFLLDGMDKTGQGVGDLATILATHPHLPVGWAQKLQFWANSTPAEESDPELQRIGRAFKDSGYDFKTLVREVFSSPLVTLARGTQTYADQGVTVGIARRDQLCASLSARLGLTDVCGLVTPDTTWRQGQVQQVSQLVATDAYYRAAELPSLPRNPDLFFRGSVEAMCELIADQVVDAGDASRYSSDSSALVTSAVADMVATVMGLPPSDPRSAQATQILSAHYQAALAATNRWNTTGALRSTFVLACTSPTSVLVGL